MIYEDDVWTLLSKLMNVNLIGTIDSDQVRLFIFGYSHTSY